MSEAYCMKCKEKRAMKNVEEVTMKNGKPAKKGECSTCGTKMFKIGKGPSVRMGGKVSKKSKATKKSKKSKKASKKSKKSKTGGKRVYRR